MNTRFRFFLPTAGRLALGILFLASWESVYAQAPASDPPKGYYRFPAIHGDTVVFTAEGDLWRVSIQGGMAQRVTSHLGSESHAAFSPDGKTLAFSAEYEGPVEVYTMPAEGGLPTRRTFEGRGANVVGWTPDGRVLYTTLQFSTLPDWQLATIDLRTGERSVLPLSQANEGVFEPGGKTLYFARLPFQGSSTKRYQGGTIQHLWKFATGDPEALPLTEDFPGTSKNPMWWQDRLYFVSNRDGTMNLWTMNPAGGDLQQLTRHHGSDVKSPSLAQGRIAYQLGADLHLYDIVSKTDRLIPITLTSDFDQERERCVKKPMDYLTSTHLSPDGDRLVLTARGQVFVAPAEQGKFVEATHDASIRYRAVRFMPDSKSLLALSDATGELEFYKLPANGVGKPEQLTRDGKSFRFEGLPSPDCNTPSAAMLWSCATSIPALMAKLSPKASNVSAWAKCSAHAPRAAKSGSPSTIGWSIKASPPRPNTASMARKVNGSSKATEWIQTSSWTIPLTPPSPAKMPNSKRPSITSKTKSSKSRSQYLPLRLTPINP
jgi:Tol biopolymer transport system component